MSSEESSEPTWRVLRRKICSYSNSYKNMLSSLAGYVGIRVLAKIDESTMKKNIRICGKSVRRYKIEHVSFKERQEQFDKIFASNQEHFMLLPGDKVVLRVICAESVNKS
jgi:hypothetical protein